MTAHTRITILATVVVVLLLALGAWWYFGFSLDFMKFFAAPAGYLGPPNRAAVVSCAPLIQEVRMGVPATLTTVKGFEAARWYAPEGNPATGQGFSFSVTYATSGIKKVTIESARADNPLYVDSVPCTVVVVPFAQ